MLKTYIWLREKAHAIGHDDKGVTALEYGVLAVAILTAVVIFAQQIGTAYGTIFTAISGAITAAG